jgi:2-methylcitrate dehydratase PrpD
MALNEQTMTGATITANLAEKLLAIDYNTLPPAAIDMARQVMLDGLGVIVAGSREPLGLGRLSIEYVRAMGGAEQSSVITGGFKTSMQNAAYVNGTMGHALDWDNTWYPMNHPMSPTLPAILAVAENYGLSGKKIIEAIAVAFEVQGRLRLASTGLKTGYGFHKPGTTGTFGAVAGVAKLLGLDHTQTLMALGLAGSRAGSMSANTGTMTKSSHSGHAARMGVECAVLAKMGWTANADIFGPKGFFDTFLHGDAKPELLIDGFADPLRMVDPGVGFKKYPSNYFTHRPIDAALALREEHGFLPADIERVEIVFPRFEYVDRPKPLTGLDGKFSVQYATLIALLDGEITVDSFNNERRFAADVERLLPAVSFQIDDSIPADFDRMHVIVSIWLKGGRKLVKRIEKLSGWIGFPLTREQRVKKFFSCTGGILARDRAEQVLERVERLDTLSDVRGIMATLMEGT